MRVDVKTGFICNNNCRFCVQADNKLKGNRSSDEIKRDLIESKKRCDGVVLTGGEVTIREDFFDIIRYAKELGYRVIQIQTNGRMIASKEFCKKAIDAGATEFSPALHGFCKEQHDYLTRSPGSFMQTVKGIKNLKSMGATVIANTVVVKSNYREIPKIAKLLVKLDVDQFQFAYVHALGNAMDNYDSIMPKMSLAVPFIKKGLQIGIKAGKRVMAEAIPYCLMEGYEKYIAENFVPETLIRGAKHQNTDDYTTQRKVDGKKKFGKCRICTYDDVCEGPWKEYPDKMGENEFRPIIDLRRKRMEAAYRFSKFLLDLGYKPDDFYFDDLELYLFMKGAKPGEKETRSIDVRIKDRLNLLTSSYKSRLFKDTITNERYIRCMKDSGYGLDIMQKKIKSRVAVIEYSGLGLRISSDALERRKKVGSDRFKGSVYGFLLKQLDEDIPIKPNKEIVEEIPDSIRGNPVNSLTSEIKGVVNKDPVHTKMSFPSVLIAKDTSARHLESIMRSDAVVVEKGGLSSHAAIVCRELGIPCIINAKGITRKFKDGDLISLDFKRGEVKSGH